MLIFNQSKEALIRNLSDLIRQGTNDVVVIEGTPCSCETEIRECINNLGF
jgi:hypothetical protein